MTRRARRWWQDIAAEAAEAPEPTDTTEPRPPSDPWADRAGAAATLTADQRAVLAGFDDQPAPPHIDGLDGHDDDQPAVPHLRGADPGTAPGNGTGNPPGDPGPGLSYRRTRWNRREQER